jgi:zinc protease
MSMLRNATTSPDDIASRAWWSAAFPGQSYGRPVTGVLDSVPRISIDDLRRYTKHVLARDTLKVAVVGDIDADTLGRLLDRTFGSLPTVAELQASADAKPLGLGRRLGSKLDVPQAVVMFGAPGIARNDPDFMAAYLVNHILGGGSFTSRLYRELREKRGFVYGVSTSLVWLNHATAFLGSTATSSSVAHEAVDIIDKEVARMGADGPTEEELAEAKSYVDGSFEIALDSSSKIASQLVQMQLDHLGIDYIQRRSGMIAAVTLDDTRRVAKRLFSNGLLFSVVGQQ